MASRGFDHVACAPGVERRLQIRPALMHGDEDQPCPRQLLPDLGRRVDPVQQGHTDSRRAASTRARPSVAVPTIS